MPDDELAADLALISELAVQAGVIAMGFFGEDPEVWMKENDSPVSQADYAVDLFLKEKLLAARPTYGWLSEETVDDKSRLKAERTFVVDPIDGTRGFLNRQKQWCISVAIVCSRRPIAGVLHAPVLGQTLAAHTGLQTTLNDQPVTVREHPQTLLATGPRPFLRTIDSRYKTRVEALPFVPSLAWRIGLVAMGRLDLAVARGSARDWDLAAADIIVHQAGGALTDMSGKQLLYNCSSTRHSALVSSAAGAHKEMLDLAKDAIDNHD